MAMEPARINAYQVGEWQVEPELNRIHQAGQAGQAHKLESRVMALLVYLASHPGKLVTREELEESVWESRVVGYDSLTSAITKLRKALGDSTREPRYIETVPKKGYRLVAPVRVPAEPEAPGHPVPVVPAPNRAKARVRYLIVVIVAGVMLALLVLGYLRSTGNTSTVLDDGPPAIAVLPFRNLDGISDQDYFSEGITADIATALSRLSNLTVISPFSTQYYTAVRPPERIADELSARYLLTGSVQRSGDRLRMNARLVKGENGEQIWAQTYDRELRDLFAVQDDITRHIIAAMQVNITQAEHNRLARRYTASLEAYDKFLLGQTYLKRFTAQDNRLARDLFQYAIDLDPAFGRAYGAKAMSYAQAVRFGWYRKTDKALNQALRLADKAIEIDADQHQAYGVQAYVYLLNQHYDKSIKAVSQAIKLNSSSADAYVMLAMAHHYNGNSDRSVPLIHRAMRINPQYPAIYPSVLGQALYHEERYEEAIRWLRVAIERNNNFVPPHVYLVASLMKVGQPEEAAWEVAQIDMLDPEFGLKNVPEMFRLRDTGDVEELQRVLQGAGL